MGDRVRARACVCVRAHELRARARVHKCVRERKSVRVTHSHTLVLGLFCKKHYKRDYILQKRPIIVRAHECVRERKSVRVTHAHSIKKTKMRTRSRGNVRQI